jgi:hypothetical protein
MAAPEPRVTAVNMSRLSNAPQHFQPRQMLNPAAQKGNLRMV